MVAFIQLFTKSLSLKQKHAGVFETPDAYITALTIKTGSAHLRQSRRMHVRDHCFEHVMASDHSRR